MNDEARLLNTLLSLVGISTLAAASRSILTEDRRSFLGFIRGLILAAFAGTIIGLIIQNYNFSPSMQVAIVGIASFVADDLLLMILAISRTFRDNPRIVIDYFLKPRK